VVKFSAPGWFALIAVVVALAVGYAVAQIRRRKHTLRFANFDMLDKVAPRRPSALRHVPTVIVLVGLMLLVVALAGPTAEAKVPRNRATVMLAIDVSLSMEATDVAPNRLAAAQEAATQFVDDLTPGVNLGIVSFAGIATVLVSPTTDRAPARQAIADLKLDERTATGEGIISSLQAIQTFQKTISGADGPAPARIVLMTDGKRTVGRDETDAAKQAADAKVPISVIAFGTTHGSINLDGSEIPVPLDTEAMQQIAALSGGDFHTAATSEELKSVYSQLGEQIGYELKEKDVSKPWLIAGTIALILGALGALVIGQRIP
jgi:Ca-activated chloride channel family protein